METKTMHMIYFSPTGTTRKVVAAVAEGVCSAEARELDLTLSASENGAPISDGVAVIGVPVYAGRVPEVCLERMAELSADGVPTAIVALYGNREFEDALVELCDVASAKGFRVIAAGAFIGEHSYSTPERPIAAGRPDVDDLQLARSFGEQFAAKLGRGDLSTPEINGNHPYKERVPLGGVAPETDPQRCTLCGRCAEVCPMGIVAVTDVVTTHALRCIMCCACVKVCPVAARPFNHPRIEERRDMLVKNCSVPKSPQLFL